MRITIDPGISTDGRPLGIKRDGEHLVLFIGHDNGLVSRFRLDALPRGCRIVFGEEGDRAFADPAGAGQASAA